MIQALRSEVLLAVTDDALRHEVGALRAEVTSSEAQRDAVARCLHAEVATAKAESRVCETQVSLSTKELNDLRQSNHDFFSWIDSYSCLTS